MSNIQQPGISAPGDKFAPAENNGALLLFFPTAFQEKVRTAHGEQDAVYARIVRLNDGNVWDNAMVFSTALVTQLKGAVPDGIVLGTLGQGENTKGNPPWLLRPHTEAEVAQAEAWMAANPRIQQAPQQAPPSAPAWNAPATPAAPQWGGSPAPAAPPAPAAGGWGSPAAPAPAAPAATGWGGAPADQVNPAAAGWGAPAAPAPAAPPAPAPAAPAGPPADPGLVAALQAKGVPVPPGMTHEAALGLWALYGG